MLALPNAAAAFGLNPTLEQSGGVQHSLYLTPSNRLDAAHVCAFLRAALELVTTNNE